MLTEFNQIRIQSNLYCMHKNLKHSEIYLSHSIYLSVCFIKLNMNFGSKISGN